MLMMEDGHIVNSSEYKVVKPSLRQLFDFLLRAEVHWQLPVPNKSFASSAAVLWFVQTGPDSSQYPFSPSAALQQPD